MRIFLGFFLLMILGNAFAQNQWKEAPEPPSSRLVFTGLPSTSFLEEEDLMGWLKSHFPVLALSGIELQVQHDIQSLTASHKLIKLRWLGIPLDEMFVKVRLSKAGEILSMAYVLPAASELPLQIERMDQPSIVQQRWAKSEGAHRVLLDSVWRKVDDHWIAAYSLTTFSDGEHPSWKIWVNAQTQEEIYRLDRAAYLKPTDGDTTGKARVFRPNPCTAANVNYGDWFVDSMDAHKAIFETLMDTVVLNDILWDPVSQVFRLIGPYVRVDSLKSSSPAPATSEDGNFYFRRDQSQFEDVMIYYHIDRFQRYVQSLGFANLQNLPISVDPHGFVSDVSAFVPNNGDSYLLYGTGGVDDGEDADVIIHEYGHALSDAASPETNAGRERRGIDEGIGDYFSASYSYSFTPHKWEMLFNWDGHNEFWDGRIANSTQTYPPPNSLSIYAFGEIWSSALMKMRLEIGRTVADKLVLESMYTFFSGMTMQQAGRLLFSADSLLYGSAHREVIRRYLCQHKIDSDPLVPCLVVGNTKEYQQDLGLVLAPNPSNGLIEITWKARPETTYHVSLINMMGQLVQEEVGNANGKLSLQLSLPQGWYLLRLSDDAGRQATRKLFLNSD